MVVLFMLLLLMMLSLLEFPSPCCSSTSSRSMAAPQVQTGPGHGPLSSSYFTSASAWANIFFICLARIAFLRSFAFHLVSKSGFFNLSFAEASTASVAPWVGLEITYRKLHSIYKRDPNSISAKEIENWDQQLLLKGGDHRRYKKFPMAEIKVVVKCTPYCNGT